MAIREEDIPSTFFGDTVKNQVLAAQEKAAAQKKSGILPPAAGDQNGLLHPSTLNAQLRTVHGTGEVPTDRTLLEATLAKARRSSLAVVRGVPLPIAQAQRESDAVQAKGLHRFVPSNGLGESSLAAQYRAMQLEAETATNQTSSNRFFTASGRRHRPPGKNKYGPR